MGLLRDCSFHDKIFPFSPFPLLLLNFILFYSGGMGRIRRHDMKDTKKKRKLNKKEVSRKKISQLTV